MSKIEKSNIEEAFCDFLEKNHKGYQKPISSKSLEIFFGLKGSEIRKLVNSLRCKGVPICSDSDGYYYASNQQELKATIMQLDSRINQIAKARDGLANKAEKSA